MRLDDSAPDGSESSVVSDSLGLEDVGHSLAKVKAGIFLVVHTLYLEQRECLVLVSLSSFEAHEHCLGVQSIP